MKFSGTNIQMSDLSPIDQGASYHHDGFADGGGSRGELEVEDGFVKSCCYHHTFLSLGRSDKRLWKSDEMLIF
jgi:hypothetical protein